MKNKFFIGAVLFMILVSIMLFAESPFPETVIQDKDSQSPYATTENLFSPENPYGAGQHLNGQCTWYVYGRVIELVDNGYLSASLSSTIYNAFEQYVKRDGLVKLFQKN